MKKIFKLSFVFIFAILVSACGNNFSDNALITMGNQEVTYDDVFNQARIDSQGQGYFSLIDSVLLEENYSYENNERVREATDSAVSSNLGINPGLMQQFNATDNLDLARKSGMLLNAQRQAFIRDYFEKNILQESTLHQLYDARDGELISFNKIELDETLFDNDPERLAAAVTSIKEQLASATPENVRGIFDTLANQYPGDGNNIENGFQESVEVTSLPSQVLEALENLQTGEFTTEPVQVDGTYYFLFKSVDDIRQSFDARREALTDTAFANATQENPWLSDFILYQLRREANIEFKDDSSRIVFEQAMNNIRNSYNETVANLQGGN